MVEIPSVAAVRQDWQQFVADAAGYFDEAQKSIGNDGTYFPLRERDFFWDQLSDPLQLRANQLVDRLLILAKQLAPAMRASSLISEGDQRGLMTGTKTMRAALLLRRFESRNAEVIHDEGTVLGMRPASQSDNNPLLPTDASDVFTRWAERIKDIMQLIDASGTLSAPLAGDTPLHESASRYRPGTAFIMMWMDKSIPELDDVSDTVKQVFESFGVRAIRADDIEHEGLITTRILDEISTTEFLFADLTGARPSVYYEVGYAHALRKRVILCRKAGTGIHFDLAGYNCPEYHNLRELKDMLTKRLEHVTSKSPKPRE